MSPAGPVGYFLIDSLDSLLLTGLTDEYRRARDWVEKLDFNLDDKFHTFEVNHVLTIFDLGKSVIDVRRLRKQITIRVLGGLLSAYHYSGENDQMLLDKAVDLADRLLPAFETVRLFPRESPISRAPLARRQGRLESFAELNVQALMTSARSCAQPSGLPMSFVNLAQRQGIPDPDNRGMTSVAEAGYVDSVSRSFSETRHLYPCTDMSWCRIACHRTGHCR